MLNRNEKFFSGDITLAELRLKNDLLEFTPTKQFSKLFTIQRSDISMIQGRFQLKVTLTKSTPFRKELLSSNNKENIDKLYLEFLFSCNYPYDNPSCILINNEVFDLPFVCGFSGKLDLDTLSNWKTHYTLGIVINDLIQLISEYEKSIDISNLNKKYNFLNGSLNENTQIIINKFDSTKETNKIASTISFDWENKSNFTLTSSIKTDLYVNSRTTMLIDDDISGNLIRLPIQNKYTTLVYNSNFMSQFLKKCKIDVERISSPKHKSKRSLQQFLEEKNYK